MLVDVAEAVQVGEAVTAAELVTEAVTVGDAVIKAVTVRVWLPVTDGDLDTVAVPDTVEVRWGLKDAEGVLELVFKKILGFTVKANLWFAGLDAWHVLALSFVDKESVYVLKV